ncbi:SH3 domain-containing protein PJ696.02 isoform X2 [Abrus precatorius]|uniref:SH3 domain-containing protein PJ696.02 isoform X2 n=1 Tax=Abrus precatorius TaxID=3816 RepID=A0A8B8JG18_ABRPR|nr:SH3 domain-containing protein PJ696.02 isoform X2 [Abrus precatorius]
MAASDGRVTYSSLSNLEKENTHFGYDATNHHGESAWSEPKSGPTIGPPGSTFSNQEILYQFPSEDDGLFDGGYESGDDAHGIVSSNKPPEVAKHDVMDWTCARGWINLPIGLSMEHEIYKASNTLRNYCQVAKSNPEKSIPLAVLKNAKGLAILTVAKAGALVSYKLGTGLVVARRSDGSWSAPSAIFTLGLGWGAQIGGELMDFIIVLHDMKAVKTFCSRMHFSLGAGCSAAAGPVGRVLEADIRAGDRGSGMCYTYSCSKGAFVGVSMEGNIVATRMDANLRFYGDPYLTTSDILLGMVDRPKAAQPLYASLQELYSSLRY